MLHKGTLAAVAVPALWLERKAKGGQNIVMEKHFLALYLQSATA